MYYFYIGRAIGGMEFVHCTEVVRLSESPLLDVSLYIPSYFPSSNLLFYISDPSKGIKS